MRLLQAKLEDFTLGIQGDLSDEHKLDSGLKWSDRFNANCHQIKNCCVTRVKILCRITQGGPVNDLVWLGLKY